MPHHSGSTTNVHRRSLLIQQRFPIVSRRLIQLKSHPAPLGRWYLVQRWRRIRVWARGLISLTTCRMLLPVREKYFSNWGIHLLVRACAIFTFVFRRRHLLCSGYTLGTSVTCWRRLNISRLAHYYCSALICSDWIFFRSEIPFYNRREDLSNWKLDFNYIARLTNSWNTPISEAVRSSFNAFVKRISWHSLSSRYLFSRLL